MFLSIQVTSDTAAGFTDVEARNARTSKCVLSTEKRGHTGPAKERLALARRTKD